MMMTGTILSGRRPTYGMAKRAFPTTHSFSTGSTMPVLPKERDPWSLA